jgi:hypothetical protein
MGACRQARSCGSYWAGAAPVRSIAFVGKFGPDTILPLILDDSSQPSSLAPRLKHRVACRGLQTGGSSGQATKAYHVCLAQTQQGS